MKRLTRHLQLTLLITTLLWFVSGCRGKQAVNAAEALLNITPKIRMGGTDLAASKLFLAGEESILLADAGRLARTERLGKNLSVEEERILFSNAGRLTKAERLGKNTLKSSALEEGEMLFEKVKPPAPLKTKLAKELLDKKCFLVNRQLSKAEIEVLAEKQEIRFIVHEDVIKQYDKIPDFEFIVIAPRNEIEAMRAFDIDKRQAKKLCDLYHSLGNEGNIKIVYDQTDLLKQLQRVKHTPGKEPVLVFNNKGGKIFGRPVKGYDFCHSITCNSYDLEPLSKSYICSSTELGVNNVLKSLKQEHNAANFKDFWVNFINTYDRELTSEKRYRLLVTSGKLTGGAVALSVVIYKGGPHRNAKKT